MKSNSAGHAPSRVPLDAHTDPHRGTRLEYVSEALLTTCNILSAVANAANVPVMAGVASVVTEVITIAKNVRDNKIKSDELLKGVYHQLRILDECHGCLEEDIPEEARDAFKRFIQAMDQLRLAMQRRQQRNVVARIACNLVDRDQIADWKESRTRALDDLQLAVSVIIIRHIASMQRKLDSLSDQLKQLHGLGLSTLSHTDKLADGVHRMGAEMRLRFTVLFA